MPSLEVEFTVNCKRCGTTLEAWVRSGLRHPVVEVESCDTCIDRAVDKAVEDARAEEP